MRTLVGFCDEGAGYISGLNDEGYVRLARSDAESDCSGKVALDRVPTGHDSYNSAGIFQRCW